MNSQIKCHDKASKHLAADFADKPDVSATTLADRGVHEFQDVEHDTTAPTPDPTWAKQPYATRDSAVAMAATQRYLEVLLSLRKMSI